MMKPYSGYNWWKISFLLTIFLTSGCLVTLFQLGVLQIRLPSKDVGRHLVRRSAGQEDFEVDESKGAVSFPSPFEWTSEDKAFLKEGEDVHYYNDDNSDESEENGDTRSPQPQDEDEDENGGPLLVDENEDSSGDDQVSSATEDIEGLDDEKARAKNKDRKEDEKKKAKEDGKAEAVTEEGKTKVSDKQNVLSEDELLNFHSKAVSKIWAPNIERNLVYLSSKSHLGGTKESAEFAAWMSDQFKLAKLDNVQVAKYNVLCSYPTKAGKIVFEGKDGEKDRELEILEEKLDSFEKSTNNSVYPPYLAYSMPSTEEGELVYANYGDDEDFRKLKEMGLDCKDKILFIRYGKLARNKKIKAAEECGAKGVILFSDPLVYSPTGTWYPDTWYLPPDGVMRGTLAQRRGDALTRGYPAIPGFYRRPISEVTFYPKIPVQPIGFGHAEKIFKQLDGRPVPEGWSGGLNISYHVNSKSGNKAKLLINVTKEMREIQNVIGIIEGTYEPDRLVLVGNHRDAWGYGAADPSSGTAVLVEMARVLGELKKEGWKPRRTIMICSWDAEEFGLLGSTEWTEQYAKVLSQQAVAYVNVDTAVQGNHTIALRSTPELADVFFDTAQRFKDPDSSENLYDSWLRKHRKKENDQRKEPKVTIFREGSDYMPFYGDLGIPSLDFRYMFDEDALGVYNIPVYHTMHDNINWMRKFVDPDFRYHAAITQVLTRIILLLADSTLLPFNLIRYSDSMWARVKRLRHVIDKHDVGGECDISLLTDLVAKLQKVTRQFHRNVQLLDKEDELAVRQINDQMLLFERSFVANEDLIDDDKTRHVYHTSGLRRATFAVVRAKKKGTKKGIETAVRDFKTKYSIYTYHAMMAIQALEHPFLTKEKS